MLKNYFIEDYEEYKEMDNLFYKAFELVCRLFEDKVDKNETIATIYYNDEKNLSEVFENIETAFEYIENKPQKRTLLYKIVEWEEEIVLQ